MVLAAVLGQALYRLKGLYPWPLDRRCVCERTFHKRSNASACGWFLKTTTSCHRVAAASAVRFAAKLRTRRVREVRQGLPGGTGLVESFEGGGDLEPILSRVLGPFHHSAGRSM